MPADRIDTIVNLAKRRGFVYPSSEIYGGQRSAWDYGPLGVELKDNIKRQWWKSMVQSRDDVVGLDSSIILAREVWEASGHVDEFVDPLTECQSCHKRFRADHLEEAYEEKHGRPPANGLADVVCPNCGTRGAFTEPRMFNGLLKTHLGPVEDESGLAYLRPETAQGIFINYLNVLQSQPAQAAVRHRPDRQVVPQRDHAGQLHLPDPRVRADGDGVLRQARHRRGVARLLDRRAHAVVHATSASTADNLRLFEHPKEKLSHYSKRTVDIEYRFRFAGSEWGELEGIANRTDFDLTTHSKHSGADLSYFDQETGERWVPYVIEPAAGVGPADDGLPDRRLHRGRGAERQGRAGEADRAAAGPAAGAGEGRGAAAVPQRRPVAEGPRPGRAAAPQLERRLRRRRRDRPPLPPAGRDRHAVLPHRRLRHARGRGGDRPGARLDGPGAGRRWTRCRATWRSGSAAVRRRTYLGRPPRTLSTDAGDRGGGSGRCRGRGTGSSAGPSSSAGWPRRAGTSGPAAAGCWSSPVPPGWARPGSPSAARRSPGRPGCGWPGAGAGPAAARRRCGRGRRCWPSCAGGRPRRCSPTTTPARPWWTRSGSPASSRSVSALAAACAATPAYLVLDDLHGAEPAAVLLTRYLARLRPRPALLLVVTARDGPGAAELAVELEATSLPVRDFDLADTRASSPRSAGRGRAGADRGRAPGHRRQPAAAAAAGRAGPGRPGRRVPGRAAQPGRRVGRPDPGPRPGRWSRRPRCSGRPRRWR